MQNNRIYYRAVIALDWEVIAKLCQRTVRKDFDYVIYMQLNSVSDICLTFLSVRCYRIVVLLGHSSPRPSILLLVCLLFFHILSRTSLSLVVYLYKVCSFNFRTSFLSDGLVQHECLPLDRTVTKEFYRMSWCAGCCLQEMVGKEGVCITITFHVTHQH